MPLTNSQREKLDEANWIHASTIVEVQGNDKDYIKKALDAHIDKIKKERGIEVYDAILSEPRELHEKLYSTNAELKFIAKDFNVLVRMATMYSPSALEIYSPKKITLPIGDAQNILADISNIVTSLAHTIFIQEGQLRKLRGEPADAGK